MRKNKEDKRSRLLDLQELREKATTDADRRKFQVAIDNHFLDNTEYNRKKKAAQKRKKRRNYR